MRSHRRLAAVALPLAVLVPLGCTSSDGAAANGSTTTSPATTTSASTTTTERPVASDQTSPGGANGIKVADDGTLWIASIASDELLNVDPDTGSILRRISLPEGTGPDDVVLGDDGTVFWTGFVSGAVGAADPASGEVTVLAEVGTGANPIALRDDGVLVVGRAISATGLYEIAPDGASPPVLLSDPGMLNSFDITPDGALFAPNLDTNSVDELDPVSGEIVRSVAALDGPPIALRWHDGTAYVLALIDGAKVLAVDPATGAVELFSDTGLAVGDNLAVGEDGTVFVTGLNEPTVTVISSAGVIERTVRIGL